MGYLTAVSIASAVITVVFSLCVYNPTPLILVGGAFIACLVCLSVYLYTPLPDRLGEPMKVHGVLFPYSVFNLMFRTMSVIGFGEFVKIKRSFYIKMAVKMTDARQEPLLEITDTTFDDVPVRIFRPKSSSQDSPAFLYIHGGGWTFGDINYADKFLCKMAKYRLGPENPFPAAFDDCKNAALHLFKNHEKYGIDANKVVIGGDSAGGNLAAAVTLFLSNETNLPRVSLQYLIYPCLQAFNFKLPSYTDPKNNALLSPYEMAWYWSNYVGPTSHPDLAQAFLDNQHTSPEIKKSHYAELVNPEVALPKEYLGKVEHFDVNSGNASLWKEIEGVVLNPYFSPMMASKLDNLPPSVIITAEHDVLRSDGLMYAQRLRQAGLKVKHREYNMLHGFVVFADRFQVSIESTDDVVKDLKEHFGVSD